MAKVHDLLTIEHQRMVELPHWATRFLKKVQDRGHTAKPAALLLSESSTTESLVLLRLADLLELMKVEE